VPIGAIGPKRRRSTRWCATTSRRSKARSTTGRSRCGSRNTPARSWRPTSTVDSSAGALRGCDARTAARAGWWRSVVREGDFAPRVWDGGCARRPPTSCVSSAPKFPPCSGLILPPISTV
jgi:hypothetical protein